MSRKALSVLGLIYFNFFIKKLGSGIVRFAEGVFGSVIIIFVFLLGLFCFLFESKIIGFFGELWTKKDLKKLPKEYKILNNIMIKVNNSTHQIDHIVVSKYGIFVIETK